MPSANPLTLPPAGRCPPPVLALLMCRIKNASTNMTVKDLSRVARRPTPEEWGEDELITLPETAALYWPDGPITTSTLRNAARKGKLRVVELAGKHFTNRTAVEEMCRSATPLVPADPTAEMKRDLLNELDELKRRRTRRRDSAGKDESR